MVGWLAGAVSLALAIHTTVVSGHSYLLCADYVADSRDCKAYPRYYASNAPNGYRDRNLAEGSFPGKPCPPMGLAGSGDMYTAAYPALTAAAGQVIRPSWAERGHSSQGQSNSAFLIRKVDAWGNDGSLADYQQIGSMPYSSNCRPDVPLSGDAGAQHCWGEVTLPATLVPGKYTMSWKWMFNAIGALFAFALSHPCPRVRILRLLRPDDHCGRDPGGRYWWRFHHRKHDGWDARHLQRSQAQEEEEKDARAVRVVVLSNKGVCSNSTCSRSGCSWL